MKDKPEDTDPIEEHLRKLYGRTPDLDRKIILHRGCLTYGVVTVGGPNDKVCDDPNCAGCRMWDDAVRQAMENFLDYTEDGEGFRGRNNKTE